MPSNLELGGHFGIAKDCPPHFELKVCGEDEQVDEVNKVEEAGFMSALDQLMFIRDERPGTEPVYQSLFNGRLMVVLKR